jgi:hypothetical protein
MLSDIEVLDKADDNYWTATAYTIPDTPYANITPGQTGVKMVPINRMPPRSFITNIAAGSSVPAGAATLARGIAFGGDAGVASVDFSADGGKSWRTTTLGPDYGKYSFRQWQTTFTLPDKGEHSLMVRCANIAGEIQPDDANWNTSGFMRNVIEAVTVAAS